MRRRAASRGIGRRTSIDKCANVAGQNPWVIGIVVAGVLTREPLAADDLAALKRLVAVLDRFLGRQLPCEPHSKWVQTACPGDPLRGALATLRVPAPPPTAVTLAATLLSAGAAAQRIRLNRTSALQIAITRSGLVPASDEFELVHAGVRYVARLAEHLTTGAVRVFYCRVGDWANVERVQRP